MTLQTSPYSFSEFSPQFKYLLEKINSPTDTPKLDLFLSRLKDLQAIKLEKEFTALSKIDLSLIDNERAKQHTQVDFGIYSDSPFYYFLISEKVIWNELVQICALAFLINTVDNSNFDLKKQNEARKFLTAKKLVDDNVDASDIFQHLDSNIIEKGELDDSFNQLLKFFTLTEFLACLKEASRKQLYHLCTCFFWSQKWLTKTRHHVKLLKAISKSHDDALSTRAIFSRIRTPIENNFLDYHNNVLNDKEARELYCQLLDIFNDSSTNKFEKVAASSLLLMLTLGLDFSWLQFVSLESESLNRKLEENEIHVTTAGIVTFNVVSLTKEKPSEEYIVQWLDGKHSPTLSYGLPVTILPVIHFLQNKKIELFTPLNKLSVKHLVEKLTVRINRSINQNKIRDFLLSLYFRYTSDEVIATLLCPLSTYSVPSGCYYTAVKLEIALECISSNTSMIFGPLVEVPGIDSSKYIGSKYNFCIDKVVNVFQRLEEQIETNYRVRSTEKELINFHNNYVMYVATVAFILTGHRPVNDIFNDRNFLFEDHDLLLISDKGTADKDLFRFVPLCDVLKEQFELYLEHLINLSKRIHKHNSLLAQQVYELTRTKPEHEFTFLSLIKNGKLVGISSKDLDKYLEVNLHEKINFNRQLLSTYLANNNVKREVINHLLGHSLKGQSPLLDSSPINIKIALSPLISSLNSYAEALGLKAQKGLNSGHKNHSFNGAELSTKNGEYGYKNRTSNNRKEWIKAEEISQLLVQSCFFQISDINNEFEEISSKQLDKVEHYLNDKNTTPLRLKGKVSAFLQKAISSYYKSFNRPPLHHFDTLSEEKITLIESNMPYFSQRYLLLNSHAQEKLSAIVEQTKNLDEFYAQISSLYICSVLKNLPANVDICEFLRATTCAPKLTGDSLYYVFNINSKDYNWFPPVNILALLLKIVSPGCVIEEDLKARLSEDVERLRVEMSFDSLTINDIFKLSYYSHIFFYSPAELKQRRHIAFFSKNIESNKVDKPQTPSAKKLIKQNTFENIEFNEFIDALSKISNKIRSLSAFDGKNELLNVLKSYSSEYVKCDVTRLLAEYGLYILEEGTRRNKGRGNALTTPFSYINSIASEFYMLLRAEKVLDVNSDTYSAIFDYIANKYQQDKLCVSALLNLADFLYTHKNIGPIVFNSHINDEDSVDVNLFTEAEVNQLIESPFFNEEERLFILTLSEIPSRRSEVYSLIKSDINLTGEQVHIRTNRLNKVKNRYSNRVYPFRLIDEDLNHQLKEHLVQFNKKAPIFDRKNKTLSQQNFDVFIFNINQKIKAILKREVSLKHFRHFKISQQFNELQTESCRDYWQLVGYSGHSSPETPQRNYIHNAFTKNFLEPVSDEFVANRLSCSIATIRKLRSRLTDSERKDISICKQNSLLLLKKLIKKGS